MINKCITCIPPADWELEVIQPAKPNVVLPELTYGILHDTLPKSTPNIRIAEHTYSPHIQKSVSPFRLEGRVRSESPITENQNNN